jgi:hypothetical protein
MRRVDPTRSSTANNRCRDAGGAVHNQAGGRGGLLAAAPGPLRPHGQGPPRVRSSQNANPTPSSPSRRRRPNHFPMPICGATIPRRPRRLAFPSTGNDTETTGRDLASNGSDVLYTAVRTQRPSSKSRSRVLPE